MKAELVFAFNMDYAPQSGSDLVGPAAPLWTPAPVSGHRAGYTGQHRKHIGQQQEQDYAPGSAADVARRKANRSADNRAEAVALRPMIIETRAR